MDNLFGRKTTSLNGNGKVIIGPNDNGENPGIGKDVRPKGAEKSYFSCYNITTMTSSEINIEVVKKYFDGCNSGNIDDLMSTLAPDVAHFFLPSSFPPIRGAEHLAKYWAKYQRLLNPIWKIDHIIAQGNEVVNEWSCIWTPNGTEKRLMARGSEWYVMRDARILEIRAYFISSAESNVEFATFPYQERGYLVMD